MARKARSAPEKTVDETALAEAFAKAVRDGDVVNLRLLFAPFSPGRPDSTEDFDMAKYQYLLPENDEREDRDFRECLALVRQPFVWAHIRNELGARRPAQLPSELLLPLGDNALRLGKHSAAAQAYELLRIRPRMQEEFFRQADAALSEGDIRRAVQGYLTATGLGYDYAAFPEPLPVTPDFQTRALILHAEYPAAPENRIGAWETKTLLSAAFAYLLLDAGAAARLESRPLDVQLAFLKELVGRRDPGWSSFLERYRAAAELTRAFGERLQRLDQAKTLAEEIQAQQAEDAGEIPAVLLGRAIDGGEWWQYLKELACEHPAAALCVARQAVGDNEILIPWHRRGAPVAQTLGLELPAAAIDPPANVE